MTHPLAGRKQSAEHIAKRVAACRAKGVYARLSISNIERNKAKAGFIHSEETKRKMSEAAKGKQYALGFKRSVEYCQKLSDYWKNHRKQHNHYVDGKSHERRSRPALNTLRYRLWREAVFQRDNWTCMKCEIRGCFLEAHHIKSWAKYPDMRYEVSNGMTLCKICHDKTKGKVA